MLRIKTALLDEFIRHHIGPGFMQCYQPGSGNLYNLVACSVAFLGRKCRQYCLVQLYIKINGLT